MNSKFLLFLNYNYKIMAAGNNSLNRIAGSGQSKIIKAGETYNGSFSQFVPREDTVIGTLEETVIYNGETAQVSVLGDTITLPTGVVEEGQNLTAETLFFGEIFVPRYGAFTKITPTSGSVVIYLLVSRRQADRKLNLIN